MDCSSLFQEATKQLEEIESSTLRGDSSEFTSLLDECNDKFAKLGKRVNELSLFSSNETIQDLHTSTIPYVMIPYYLALLEQKRMEDRKKHLNNAKVWILE